jgi:hypothetical protein
MRFCHALMLAALLLSQAVSIRPVFADDPPADGTASKPNAAVIYWQAFASMPRLNEEEENKFLAAAKSPTEPVSDDLRQIIARFNYALQELHRARGVTSCNWDLNYSHGILLQLPHLDQARKLARAALLRARLRFVAKETDEAIADVGAVLKMARDCGNSPLIVSLLVGFHIEDMATDVLAENLATLSSPELDLLSVKLKTLPATPSMADCERLERQFMGEEANSKESLTAYANAVLREEKAQVRRQLLLLAVQVQRDGPEAIKDSTVPNHGPVEYNKTDSGFELRCQPKSADEPVVLRVTKAR